MAIKRSQPAIGNVPATIKDPQMRSFLESLRTALQTFQGGRTGNAELDRAVTVGELLGKGFKFNGDRAAIARALANVGKTGGGRGDEEEIERPTIPAGFEVTVGWTSALLHWEDPTYKGHSYTEIFRQRTNLNARKEPVDRPQFNERNLFAVSVGNVYSDKLEYNSGYYYWIRHVNKLGQVGPIQSTEGSFVKTRRTMKEEVESAGMHWVAAVDGVPTSKGESSTIYDERTGRLLFWNEAKGKYLTIAESTPSMTEIADQINAVRIKSSVPKNNEGESIVVDGVLYRWDGKKYNSSIDAALIAGKLAATNIPALNELAGKIGVDKLPTNIPSGNLGDIPAAKIKGILSSSNIPSIPTTKLTGTLSKSSIPALHFSDIGGALAETQIPVIPKTKLPSISFSDIKNTIGIGQMPPVPTSKLTGQVNASQIAANAIGANQIAANAVTAGKIAANAVGANQISANAVTSDKIAANSVSAGHISANAVGANHIGANVIQAKHIKAGEVGAEQIAANAVTAGKIAANAVGANHIAAESISVRHLHVMNPTNVVMDSTFSDPDAWSLGGSWVIGSEDKERHIVTTESKTAVSNSDYISEFRSHAFVVSPGERYFLSYEVAMDGTEQLADPPALVCSVDIKRWITVWPRGITSPSRVRGEVKQGDWNWITTTRVVEIPEGIKYARFRVSRRAPSVGGSARGEMRVRNIIARLMAGSDLIVDGSVSAEKIEANAITAEKLAAGAVIAGKLAANAVVANNIASNAVTADKLAANSVVAAKIAAAAVGADQIAAGAISTRHLAVGNGVNLLVNPTFGSTDGGRSAFGWSPSLKPRTAITGSGRAEYLNSVSSDLPQNIRLGLNERILVLSNTFTNYKGLKAGSRCLLARTTEDFNLEPGKKYIASAYYVGVRCYARLRIEEIDMSSGSAKYIRVLGYGTPIFAQDGDASPAAFRRTAIAFTAPTGAGRVVRYCFEGYINHLNYNDDDTAAMYFMRPMLEAAGDGVRNGTNVSPSDWVNSGMTVIDGGQIITNSITSAQMSAGFISAYKAEIKNFAAEQISASTISGDKVTATDTLWGNLIRGKRITAETAKVANSLTVGDRVKIDGNGIEIYGRGRRENKGLVITNEYIAVYDLRGNLRAKMGKLR
ncbi:hypothetical protein HPC37_02775 [Pasteurellaceae bacterium 20609_3]|uniref:hypothetical protein n=1 Tax=Spirabiliibacterium mucosae TaxID=28156 RepID=UPI001AAC8131|nr:hypothetical protein [Spirabiliibacterium mucosae]MBE2897778.1 hypothetical protein [Spirabiliibacterium mucosae]